jgi:CubicO group peptidase (beta-lactamase class C family)
MQGGAMANGRSRLRCYLLIAFGIGSAFSDACAQSSPDPIGAMPATNPLANKPTIRALVVARGDCLISEYYRKDIGVETRSSVYSITKSVLSILVGIAIDKGYLRLDEKLVEVLPEAFDANADPLAANITVRDLLTMTAGFAEIGQYTTKATYPDSDYWRWMLNRPIKYPPGSHFRYDDIGANFLSVVLSKAVPQDESGFAREHLFGPLGINNYNWISDYQGHLLGESGLYMTARDMAKIGLLYLRRGRWGDQQIVSEPYVDSSTDAQSEGGAPVHAAYGYLWWTRKTKAGDGAFFAAGYRSQVIYVAPNRDVVVAMSAEGVPGGSSNFIESVVLPAEAALPGSAPCVARLEPPSRD